MTALRRLAPVLALTVLLAIPGAAASDDPFKVLALIRPTRVKPAPDFTVAAPDGRPIRLAEYRGGVVLVNFWATWCPTCREEMPALERLHARFRADGLVVLAIAIDPDGASAVVPFVAEHGLTYPVGLDPKMTVSDRFGVRALPSSFLVDRRGRLVARAFGPREWSSEAAYRAVTTLLAQQ